VQHLVLDERIFVDQLVHVDVLMKKGVFVEAGGEKAAQLGGIAVHGRVRAQCEAEELELHYNTFLVAVIVKIFRVQYCDVFGGSII